MKFKRKWQDGEIFQREGFRSLFAQAVAISLLVGGLAYLGHNAGVNLERQGIATGFDFMGLPTGWDVGETLVHHSSSDPYWWTLFTGFLNTLYVSAVAIVLITFLGILIGACRISKNWLLAKLASGFVEIFRNVPTILQIIFWCTVIRQLPHARDAIVLWDSIMLSNRGINFPTLVLAPGIIWGGITFAFGIVGTLILLWVSEARRDKTGRPFPVLLPSIFLLLVLPLAVWAALGAPVSLNIPIKARFGIKGGAEISPEFAGLLFGLTLHYAAQAGEIVRSGIEAVPIGQSEAARAIGLKESRIFRKIILPQALRVIVPPMTTEYMSTVRNSSLAVSIGYPELFSLGSTAINQTGQAVEIVLIMLIVYLSISAVISIVMNTFNSLLAFKT